MPSDIDEFIHKSDGEQKVKELTEKRNKEQKERTHKEIEFHTRHIGAQTELYESLIKDTIKNRKKQTKQLTGMMIYFSNLIIYLSAQILNLIDIPLKYIVLFAILSEAATLTIAAIIYKEQKEKHKPGKYDCILK